MSKESRAAFWYKRLTKIFKGRTAWYCPWEGYISLCNSRLAAILIYIDGKSYNQIIRQIEKAKK